MTIPTAVNYWKKFPQTYRAEEMALLAQWIATGESGSVVGLAGVGRATLLGFLCNRPDALQAYLPAYAAPVTLVSLDLNNLPDNRPATLYRIILRSFHEAAVSADEPLREIIKALYRRTENVRDPFVAQSALRELLLLFQARETQVVLVINRFDQFCRQATPQMITTLRGLRDSFKNILSYLMGMREEVAYFSERRTIGPLYAILDTRVCHVGPLSEADGRHMIGRETSHLSPSLPEGEVGRLLALTGGYPSLIRVACYWRMSPEYKPRAHWLYELLHHPGVRHRLGELWAGLTEEEKEVLGRLGAGEQRGGGAEERRLETGRLESGRDASPVVSESLNLSVPQSLHPQDERVLEKLAAKGVCCRVDGRWRIVGELLAAYIAGQAGDGRGRIWLDQTTGDLYQGRKLLDNLQPLERSVLRFLVENPYARHDYTELIESAWPPSTSREGVSNEALFQVVRGIRKRVEPTTERPRYLLNYRANPEGGYRFFPEGQPGQPIL